MKIFLLNVLLVVTSIILSCSKNTDDGYLDQCETSELIKGKWTFKARYYTYCNGDPDPDYKLKNITTEFDDTSFIEFKDGEFTWYEEYDGEIYRDDKGETKCLSDGQFLIHYTEGNVLIRESIKELTSDKLVFEESFNSSRPETGDCYRIIITELHR